MVEETRGSFATNITSPKGLYIHQSCQEVSPNLEKHWLDMIKILTQVGSGVQLHGLFKNPSHLDHSVTSE